MKNTSPKWLRLGWFDVVPFWNGLQAFATLCERRMLRLLNRVIDVDALRPRKAKKRTYLPEVLTLETRMVPTLSISGVNSYMATADTPISSLNDDMASVSDTNGLQAPSAYTLSIQWGDGVTSGALLVGSNIESNHVYLSAGTYTFTINASGDGGSASANGTSTISAPFSPTATYTPSNTPQVATVPFGPYTISLLTGGVRDTVALNASGVGLEYNGDSVGVYPVIEATYPTSAGGSVPASVSDQLTWNGTAQATLTYSTTADSAGDVIVMDVRSTAAVTSSGAYSWSLAITPAGGMTTTVTGTAYIGVSASSEGFTAGNGWTISGVDRLVSVTGGLMWKDGDGNARFFAANGMGSSYTSPPGDFGSLTYSMFTSTYSYVAKGGLYTEYFDSSGYESKKVTADGQTTTFTRSGGELTSVETPDDRFVSFTYDISGNLQTVQMPSGTATLTHDGSGNLTVVERPDTSLLSFSYDANGRATVAKTADATASFTYDSNGMLDSIDGGLSDTETVKPQLAQASGTSATNLEGSVAVTTDALSRATTAMLDGNGEPVRITTPDGAVQQFIYDSNYRVAFSDNPLHGVGQLGYSSGDLTNVTAPSGATVTLTYDPTLHEVTSAQDPLGNLTTMTYTGTGDEQTQKDPTGGVTTYAWSGGLLQTTTDANGHLTTNVYDANNDLIAVISPTGLRVSYTYDAAGNRTSVEQPDGTVTTTLYDAMGRPTGTINPDGTRTTTTYDAAGNVQSTTDVHGNLTSYVYDSDGREIAVIDPLGNRTSTVYDNAGEVIATVDQYGNRTSFAYDSAGRQTSVEDQYGHYTTTVYNAAGEVTATVNMYGQRTSFSYDANGNQITKTDPYGNVTTSVYDAAGNLIATVDPYGNRTSFVYDAAGRRIATEDQYGHFSTTAYDAASNVIANVDVYGNRTSAIYDSYGRQVATEDQYGHFTTTVFDTYGRVSAQVDVYGNAVTTLYDAYGRVQATVDALGNRTSIAYDAYGEEVSTQTSLGYTSTVYDSFGRVQATEDALGNFTTTVYDSFGRVEAKVDPLGNRTTYLFDSLGRPSATENALGNVVTTVYDSYGRVSASQDDRGNSVTTIYDSDGRVAATENQLGNYTSTIYDSLGRVAATEDSLGHYTTTIYDSLGRVSATEDGRGNLVSTVYDSYGRVAATENQLGNYTSTIYDSLGRVAATENQLGAFTSTLYDSYGRPVGSEDPLTHITTTIFDSYGRQVATQDPLANLTTSVLDSFGRQVNLIDADNNKTTFVYDALGREVNQISPTGGVTTMAYDADGRLTSQASSTGTQITYGYDAVGDNIGQTWYNADGTVNARLTFTYDANGNQLTASNSVGTYTMAYDAANEMTSVQQPWGTVLTFTYDANGRRAVMQDNFGGVTSYAYDANGNLTQVLFGGTSQTPMRIDLGYDASNQLTSETRYSDLAGTTKVATTSMAYDGAGNRTNQLDLNGSGGNIANYSWTYDAADRLTTEKLNGGATVSYSYDADNELIGDGVTTPTYDSTGNRSGTNYTVGTGNELTADPNDTYSYDAAGEETKDVITTGPNAGNTWLYKYDPKGELIQAQLWTKDPAVYSTGNPEIEEVDYKYDAFGNLAERDAYPVGMGSPTVTRYGVDGWDPALAGATGLSNFNVWADLNGSNGLQTRYFHGDQVDQLFGRQDSLVAYWNLTDRLGSVRGVVDTSGNLKDALSYDGWGNIVSDSNSSYRGSYAWSGRQLDVETRLQYNRARWYDPATGRWQSPDSLGFGAGDSNLYRYATNDVTCCSDPSGLLILGSTGVHDSTKDIIAKLDDPTVNNPYGLLAATVRGGLNMGTDFNMVLGIRYSPFANAGVNEAFSARLPRTGTPPKTWESRGILTYYEWNVGFEAGDDVVVVHKYTLTFKDPVKGTRTVGPKTEQFAIDPPLVRLAVFKNHVARTPDRIIYAAYPSTWAQVGPLTPKQVADFNNNAKDNIAQQAPFTRTLTSVSEVWLENNGKKVMNSVINLTQTVGVPK